MFTSYSRVLSYGAPSTLPLMAGSRAQQDVSHRNNLQENTWELMGCFFLL